MAEHDGPEPTSGAVVPSGEAASPGAQSPVSGDRGGTPVARGTGVSAALVIGLLLAILATVIAVQNTGQVTVNFLAWEVGAPLVAVILTASIAGVVFDEVLGTLWRRRRRRNLAERVELERLRGG